LENDLHAYREVVAPRLALAGTPTTKRAALRTLAHLLRGLSEVLAPILPFTSETIHRSLSTERSSVFEQGMGGLDRTLLSDDLFAAWDRWRTVLRSVDRFRRALGVPPTTVLPAVVLVLSADDMAERLRTEKDTLARLARVQRVEIASPKQPWTGRQRAMRPVESEVQKAYPSQASQIIHLLQHMAPRRWETTAGQEELTVVINGLPRRIFPSMVAFTDTLPERVVPVAWSLGEMYIERPAGVEFARPPTPPLSSDAFWLVRRLQRRLRATPIEPGQSGRIALVTAKDPLASELRAGSVTIARYLALTELRVVEKSDDATPPTALRGRTRTGDRWSIHVPNLPPRRARMKTPREGGRLPRVSVSALSTPNVVEEVDYADEKLVAHAEVVRSLGQQLDDIIGIPLLGPAKVAIAWEHGVHSAEDLQHLSFEAVSALPGFGGPVAEVVVARLGGSVPTGARHRGVSGASTARTVRERTPPIPPAVAPPGNVSGSEPERRSSTDVAALVVPEPVRPDVPAPEIIGPDEP
ncbi:MAG: class I tRNA ligase family protein, partial [Candidatus Lutacidiplasmatales archaeon]